MRRDTYMLNTEEKEEKSMVKGQKQREMAEALANNRHVDSLLAVFRERQSARDNLKFEKNQVQQFLIYSLFL